MKGKKWLWLALFALAVLLSAGLLISACDSGGEDDDSQGNEPCDKGCLEDFFSADIGCQNSNWDCVEQNGFDSIDQCTEDMQNCSMDAFSDACACAENCNDCLKEMCDCMDNCIGDPDECWSSCKDGFENCADWFDGECIDECEEGIYSCITSCVESQNVDACRQCTSDWESCIDNCF